jgi:membrane protein involved in colicin uptake
MKHVLKAGIAAGLVMVASPAVAEDWRYCMTVVKDGNGKDRIAIFSPSFNAGASPGYASEWESTTRPAAEDALRQHLTNGSVKIGCQTIPQSRAENEDWRARHVAKARGAGILVEEFAWSPGAARRQAEEAAEASNSSDDSAYGADADSRNDEQAVASAESTGSADAGADDDARTAEYEAERRAWQEEVEARKAEEERQKAAHAEAQEKARREKAEYEAKMEAHRREREEANRRQQEYFAAQRRHALCTNGDQQACAALRSGQSSGGNRIADGGGASGRGALQGFWGPTCEAARLNATSGAGSVPGNTFEEVRVVPQEKGCLVQGYRYGGHGSASRQ